MSRATVAGEQSSRQEASATRRVTGFSDTSTMRARPSPSRWEKSESGGFVGMSGQAQETARSASGC